MDTSVVLTLIGMIGTAVVQIIVLAVAIISGKQVLSALKADVHAIKVRLMDGPKSIVETVWRHDERIGVLEELRK